MSKIAERLAELDYNEQVVLTIVEEEEDLRDIFTEEIDVKSFNLLRTLAKENQLNSETQSFLKKIFDQIILTKEELIDRYKYLVSKSKDVVEEQIAQQIVTKEVIEEVIKEPKKVKHKTDTKLPRRFGKLAIEAEIDKQGGKVTPLQNAMLKVNSLKNIYVNLSARGIKDMIGGTNLISDEDSRKIVSVITIVERQLADILKKK